ncbi:hypothetical protein PYV61_20320, partial [Roseisolibacter sp. H3M3-2]
MNADWVRFFQAPWLLPAAVVLPALVVALLLVWAARRSARAARLGHQALVARLAAEVVVARVRWRIARIAGAPALAGLP